MEMSSFRVVTKLGALASLAIMGSLIITAVASQGLHFVFDFLSLGPWKTYTRKTWFLFALTPQCTHLKGEQIIYIGFKSSLQWGGVK